MSCGFKKATQPFAIQHQTRYHLIPIFDAELVLPARLPRTYKDLQIDRGNGSHNTEQSANLPCVRLIHSVQVFQRAAREKRRAAGATDGVDSVEIGRAHV